MGDQGLEHSSLILSSSIGPFEGKHTKTETSIPILDEHNPIMDFRQKPITHDSNIQITIHNMRT